MVRTAVACSPGHISGFFRACWRDTPAATGSIGAGIVIADGVEATVAASASTRITVEQRRPDGAVRARSNGSPPVEYALSRLDVTAAVSTVCRLPIGSGFGLSAAALLASITAADAAFELGLSRTAIATLAHEAEVVHRTGLGDVAACQGGGVVCRRMPGIDAPIARIHSAEPLYAVSLGPISTPEVLGSPERIRQVEAAFPSRWPRNLAEFFSCARFFAERSGLVTPDVAAILAACDVAEVPASMTMLGRGVFAAGDRAAAVLAPFGEIYRFSVAGEGFRLLEVRE
jgi:pantoate kinase